jgi:hypothetical protein
MLVAWVEELWLKLNGFTNNPIYMFLSAMLAVFDIWPHQCKDSLLKRGAKEYLSKRVKPVLQATVIYRTSSRLLLCARGWRDGVRMA